MGIFRGECEIRFVEDELRTKSGVRRTLGCVLSVLLGETVLEIVIDPVFLVSVTCFPR